MSWRITDVFARVCVCVVPTTEPADKIFSNMQTYFTPEVGVHWIPLDVNEVSVCRFCFFAVVFMCACERASFAAGALPRSCARNGLSCV